MNVANGLTLSRGLLLVSICYMWSCSRPYTSSIFTAFRREKQLTKEHCSFSSCNHFALLVKNSNKRKLKHWQHRKAVGLQTFSSCSLKNWKHVLLYMSPSISWWWNPHFSLKRQRKFYWIIFTENSANDVLKIKNNSAPHPLWVSFIHLSPCCKESLG